MVGSHDSFNSLMLTSRSYLAVFLHRQVTALSEFFFKFWHLVHIFKHYAHSIQAKIQDTVNSLSGIFKSVQVQFLMQLSYQNSAIFEGQ